MKIKKGFTLAEAIITLGIIGVVASFAFPTLIYNSGRAKIGPALYKAKNSFENGVSMMLVERSVESISAIGRVLIVPQYCGNDRSCIDVSKVESMLRLLGNHMKIDSFRYDDTPEAYYQIYDINGDALFNDANRRMYLRFDSQDNITYWITIDWTLPTPPNAKYPNIPSNQECGEVFVDINGPGAPNIESKDVFRFVLYNDGTLRPYGSEGYRRSLAPNSPDAHYWWDNHNCDEQNVNDPRTCTGSIFDNDMKVIYE